VSWVTRSLPFVRTRACSRFHRVREATMFFSHGSYTHTAFRCWCDWTALTSNGARLFDELDGELPLCATCEGRAVGSGQLGAAVINGRPVIYTPRQTIRCVVPILSFATVNRQEKSFA
jgi:hypothetical protein